MRRWALNALARFGREPTCIEAVIQVLRSYSHEPQTAAAAIAAIYRMSRKASAVLRTLSFDEQMVTLAALQHVDANNLDLSALPLNVETASSDLLKLALLIVGLDRCPVNLLNPRHSDAEMVKVLGGHDDNVVPQYTVWAITENDSLGLKDLGIDIRSIEQQPVNVRAWLFQLIAMTPSDAEQNIEYIELGSRDPSSEARIGLALGLRDTYFDGLEALVLDWFTTEHDSDVSPYLLDHMVRQSRFCASYEAMAVEVYEKEPTGSPLRKRMEAAAAGTELYTKLRQLDIDGANDLFRVTNVTNNTFNISGGIQGAAVSIGGNADNSGEVSLHYSQQTIEAIQTELSKAERALHESGLPPEVRREALEQIEAAKATPTPDRVAGVVKVLEKAEALATAGVKAGTALGPIALAIGKAAGLV